MKPIIRIILTIALAAVACNPIYHKKTEIVRIIGSDTLLILANRWAEAYMMLNPRVSVYVEGGGTQKGVEALIAGQADICTASRPLRAPEARLLAEKYRYIGISHLVAKDALSIFINPENPVRDLSMEQLEGIFTGRISRWNAVGGLDEPITVIIRAPNSGTHQYFKEHVLRDNAYAPDALSVPTTAAVVRAVTEKRGALGYGGVVYGPGLIHCRIDGIPPTEDTVRNDAYPIIRYLYLYTTDSPRGAVKSFIDWVLKDGQKTVEQVGYVPLWRP